MEAHPKSEKSTSNLVNCKITPFFFQLCPKEKEGNWFPFPWAAAFTWRVTLKIITNQSNSCNNYEKSLPAKLWQQAQIPTSSTGLDIEGIRASLLPAGPAGSRTLGWGKHPGPAFFEAWGTNYHFKAWCQGMDSKRSGCWCYYSNDNKLSRQMFRNPDHTQQARKESVSFPTGMDVTITDFLARSHPKMPHSTETLPWHPTWGLSRRAW